jgi:uncharacterized protein (DUF2062 family)
MPKAFLRRYTPDREKVSNHKHLRWLGEHLLDPNLWHLNRRSVSGAFFIGLFWAFVPTPFQMVGASIFAIWFRKNLPISVALVWITNPITIPPIFYFTYLVGTWMLGHPVTVNDFSLSWEWFQSVFGEVWQPLLLGSFTVGLVAGSLGFAAIRLYWRWHVTRALDRRRARRSEQTRVSIRSES